MELIALIGFVVVVLLVVFTRMFGKKTIEEFEEPVCEITYESKGGLLTKAERSFFGVLEQAVGNSFRIFAKVRVADVLAPKKGLEPGDRQSAFNKIRAKHFDFVLCDPASLDIRAVVELNDKSHQQSQRSDRDEFLRSACGFAQIPMIEVAAKRGYSVETLRGNLAEI